MEIKEHQRDEITVVEFAGRLDARAAKDIREVARALVENDQIKLVFDLAAVDFIDSSGLGVLVSSLKAAANKGGDIYISRVQDHVRSVFELTRLHKLFDIYGDTETAISNFN